MKECNRIAVMVEELSKCGFRVKELDTGLEIQGARFLLFYFYFYCFFYFEIEFINEQKTNHMYVISSIFVIIIIIYSLQ